MPEAARQATLGTPSAAPCPTPVQPRRATEVQPCACVPCQGINPAEPCPRCWADCSECMAGAGCQHRGWEQARFRHYESMAQGEYVGHPRIPQVDEYRLRADDLVDVLYRRTRDKTPAPYRLNVGDEIRVESFTDPELNRELLIQPDGTITLRLLGQVPATGYTVDQLREGLDRLYQKYYKAPAITVTPLSVNTKLNDLILSVDARYSATGGLARSVRVTPEGTVALPVLGSVFVQGLTLGELQAELNERYREHIEGVQVIPVLVARAPRFVYVLGEVNAPGRYEMTGPTTVIQAISMAGSWRVGAYLKHVVVFRRDDDWRLLATLADISAGLHGNQPCPPGEIWLNDSDVVLVPKSPILRADDFIQLVFARGLYGALPTTASIDFAQLSAL
jgi:polysaccharide export outer membrane protein